MNEEIPNIPQHLVEAAVAVSPEDNRLFQERKELEEDVKIGRALMASFLSLNDDILVKRGDLVKLKESIDSISTLLEKILSSPKVEPVDLKEVESDVQAWLNRIKQTENTRQETLNRKIQEELDARPPWKGGGLLG